MSADVAEPILMVCGEFVIRAKEAFVDAAEHYSRALEWGQKSGIR